MGGLENMSDFINGVCGIRLSADDFEIIDGVICLSGSTVSDVVETVCGGKFNAEDFEVEGEYLKLKDSPTPTDVIDAPCGGFSLDSASFDVEDGVVVLV